MSVKERFLKYVGFDTASDPLSESYPSTEKQRALSAVLLQELAALGLTDTNVSEQGYVFGTLRASEAAKGCCAVGLIAHIDTSPDMPGNGIKPRIIKNYDGGDIVLNEQLGIVMRPAEFESLKTKLGEDLIVTDGTTLLGADDKAGIAEIMTALERIIQSEIPHREIKVAFTTDEEVGRGVDKFDVDAFGAEYGFTVDGGCVNAYSTETFNAASAAVYVHGLNIHPGSAKGKMKNAALIAMELQAMLPENERPETTEGREGFYHLGSIHGNEELCTLRYILRDHNAEKLAEKKRRMTEVCAEIDKKYGDGTAELVLSDSYSNMKQVLDNYPEIERRIVAAMKAAGVSSPENEPIRGGTDGSRLSFMGLPCPNLPTGGYNCHGKFEYASIDEMNTCVDIIIQLVMPD